MTQEERDRKAAEFCIEKYWGPPEELEEEEKCSFTDECDAFIEGKLHERRLWEDRVKGLVEALKFIAEGCLVPPDGGQPTLQDAVDAAIDVLAEFEKGDVG